MTIHTPPPLPSLHPWSLSLPVPPIQARTFPPTAISNLVGIYSAQLLQYIHRTAEFLEKAYSRPDFTPTAPSLTQPAYCLTHWAFSLTLGAFILTQRARSLTQRAHSLTQRCPGQLLAWLSAVLDSSKLDSALYGTAVSMTQRCPRTVGARPPPPTGLL